MISHVAASIDVSRPHSSLLASLLDFDSAHNNAVVAVGLVARPRGARERPEGRQKRVREVEKGAVLQRQLRDGAVGEYARCCRCRCRCRCLVVEEDMIAATATAAPVAVAVTDLPIAFHVLNNSRALLLRFG